MSDLPDTPDEPEMPDLAGLSGLFGQAQEMLAGAAAAAEEMVEGSSGGGMVRIRVNGRFEFDAVHIDPSAVDPADVDLLEDLVLAALRDASAQLTAKQSAAFGGLDLGGLFGS